MQMLCENEFISYLSNIIQKLRPMRLLFTLLLISSLTAKAQDAAKSIIKEKGAQTQVTIFHDNGTIAQQGFIKNNKIHGQWVSYDTEGKTTMLGFYRKGKKIGKWVFWSAKGVTEVDYDNNKPKSISRWTDQSQRIVTTDL